jgi:hypothetical protein
MSAPDFLAIDVKAAVEDAFAVLERDYKARGLTFVARRSDGRIEIERPSAADGGRIVVEVRGMKTR